jgi:hypothetical protein
MVVSKYSEPTYHPSLTRISLFPLAPLALELPHYVRQKLFFYASFAAQIICHGRSVYFVLFNRSGSYNILIRDYVPLVVLFMTTILILGHIGAREFPPNLLLRASVNVLYTGNLIVSVLQYRVGREWEVLGWYTRYTFVVDCINGSMFGIAALLYDIAWIRRHTWVSSRALGGTGIEPMVLMMPGRGPLYQSIGDEAGEGVIRLV